jgi:hypothetical protein
VIIALIEVDLATCESGFVNALNRCCNIEMANRKNIPWQDRLEVIKRVFFILIVLGGVSFVLSRYIPSSRELFVHYNSAKSQFGFTALILMSVGFSLLVATPFIPGFQMAILIMLIFGQIGVPFIFISNVLGLCLAFVVGRNMPTSWIHKVFNPANRDLSFGFGKFKAGLKKFSRSNQVASSGSIDSTGDGTAAQKPAQKSGKKIEMNFVPRVIQKFVQKLSEIPFPMQRALGIFLLMHLPGNTIYGDGGGISILCGMDRRFRFLEFFLIAVVSSAPMPLLFYFGAVNFESWIK